MSLAGRRSNRGDAYQTQMAIDWAISMLADPEIQFVETDATGIVGGGPVAVDDIVITKRSGRIYCQCKKNEPDFKDWSVSTLGDELTKAARLLLSETVGSVRFYSRSGFGKLAKLKEHAAAAGGADAAYSHGLGADNGSTDAALTALFEGLGAPSGFNYRFLSRTTFEQTYEFDTVEARQLERLGNLVSQAPLALDSLWVALDRAGAGLSTGAGSVAAETGLSREALLERLQKVGAVVAGPRSQTEAQRSLQILSNVGREWRREIDGVRLRRTATDDLVKSIASGSRSIIVTGGPGSGKSCVLLDLAEDLAETSTYPVYVQCRVFAEAEDAQQRQVLGLPADIIPLVARLAEYQRVAVLFDSLDVLSLSREHQALNFFLAQIDQLLNVPGVAVVVACRTFDALYDRRLAVRDWGLKVELPDLRWDDEIVPILKRVAVDETTLEAVTRSLIANARHLAMFVDIAKRRHQVLARTHQELTREFLDVTVRSVPDLGESVERKLEQIAADMLSRKSLEIGRERANLTAREEALLQSEGILQLSNRRTFEFTHQTLLDVLAISGWERQGKTLEFFIREMPQVPFVRPAVRAYVLYAATADRRALRAVLRAVAASSLPHHLRRLVFETFAELEPLQDDLGLVNWLRGEQPALFEAFFDRANSSEWHRFWLDHLVPIWLSEQDARRILYLAYRAGTHLATDTDRVLAFWTSVLDAEWVDQQRVAMNIGFSLGDYKGGAHAGIEPVIRRLLAQPKPDHDSLGSAVVRAVQSGSASPTLVWAYITSEVDDESVRGYRFDDKLRCEAYVFAEGGVLAKFMEQSTELLTLAIRDFQRWHMLREEVFKSDADWVEGFLRDTSHEERRSCHEISHATSLSIIARAVEDAVLLHARTDSDWWRQNKSALASSRDGAMRYWVLRALTENPLLDLELGASLAFQQEMLTYSLSFEVGELIRCAMPLWDQNAQDAVLGAIAALPDGDSYLMRSKCAMVKAVPAPFRTPVMCAMLEAHELMMGPVIWAPRIHAISGAVLPPFGFERFLDSDDEGVLRLLQHYGNEARGMRDWGDLVGGADEVGHQLREAASRAPIRFLSFLNTHWRGVPDRFKEDLLDGCREHAEHLFGRLQYDKNRWQPRELPDGELLSGLMLDELERHPEFWDRKKEAARVLNVVAEMVKPQSAERVAFHLFRFAGAQESHMAGNLITSGMNSSRGNIAEAAIRMSIACEEAQVEIPTLLKSAVGLFARDESPAVRSMIVRHLPYFISRKIDFGWTVFARAMEGASPPLWRAAEPCLYWSYHGQFSVVAPYLEILLAAAMSESHGNAEDAESEDDEGEQSTLGVWVRITTLASLSGHIAQDQHIQKLQGLSSEAAWRAAATVWAINAERQAHREACFVGLRAAMQATSNGRIASLMHYVFRSQQPPVVVPQDLIAGMFADNRKPETHYHPHEFADWLEATALVRPDDALAPLELLANFLERSKRILYDNGPIPRTLTALYREAEEREMNDDGNMLSRVVRVQDQLLAAGVHGLNDWLRAAERP